jgi:hypothetical protein
VIAHAEAIVTTRLGRPGCRRRHETPVADTVQDGSDRPVQCGDEVQIPTLDPWIQAAGKLHDLGVEEGQGLFGPQLEDGFFYISQRFVMECVSLGMEILQLH